MNIITGRPPAWIWEKAHELFKPDDTCTTYAYEGSIYNPAGIKVPHEIIAHEEVHRQQQRDIGGGEVWWKRYFVDPVFRAAQEAEAYGRQYAIFCQTQPNRDARALYLHRYSAILASAQYGTNISVAHARKAILHASGV